ncbi:MAG: hypothetical protein PVH95_12435 [Anaerolineae bacterium]
MAITSRWLEALGQHAPGNDDRPEPEQHQEGSTVLPVGDGPGHAQDRKCPGEKSQQRPFAGVPRCAIGVVVKGTCSPDELVRQDLARALASEFGLPLQPPRLEDADLVQAGIPLVGVRLRVA